MESEIASASNIEDDASKQSEEIIIEAEIKQDEIEKPTNEDEEENVKTQDNNDTAVEDTLFDNRWFYMPDSVLLCIFRYLNPKELLVAGKTCKTWNRVSQDEMLWKALFYRIYKIDPTIGIMPGNKKII